MEAQSEKAFIKELRFGVCVVISSNASKKKQFPCCCFPLRSMGFLWLLYIHSEENLISVMFFFK